jgi:hypothetical protein
MVLEQFGSRKGTGNENAAFVVTDILFISINPERKLLKFSASGPKLSLRKF